MLLPKIAPCTSAKTRLTSSLAIHLNMGVDIPILWSLHVTIMYLAKSLYLSCFRLFLKNILWLGIRWWESSSFPFFYHHDLFNFHACSFRVSFVNVLLRPEFLVLASFDNRSTQIFSSRGTYTILKVSNSFTILRICYRYLVNKCSSIL